MGICNSSGSAPKQAELDNQIESQTLKKQQIGGASPTSVTQSDIAHDITKTSSIKKIKSHEYKSRDPSNKNLMVAETTKFENVRTSSTSDFKDDSYDEIQMENKQLKNGIC